MTNEDAVKRIEQLEATIKDLYARVYALELKQSPFPFPQDMNKPHKPDPNKFGWPDTHE